MKALKDESTFVMKADKIIAFEQVTNCLYVILNWLDSYFDLKQIVNGIPGLLIIHKSIGM